CSAPKGYTVACRWRGRCTARPLRRSCHPRTGSSSSVACRSGSRTSRCYTPLRAGRRSTRRSRSSRIKWQAKSKVPASRITSQTATSDVDDARTCDCSTTFEVRERRQLHPPPRDAIAAGSSLRPLLLDLPAQLLFLLADLAGRVDGREVLGLVDRADLDLRLGRHGVGAALHPLHRLLHRLHVPKPVARDQLLGLGERTVGDGTALPGELDPLAVPARLQALADEHDARLHELLVEGAHLAEHLLVAGIELRLGLLRRLHDHH